MVVGRPSNMSQLATGKPMKFDLGAVGKSIGSWFGEKAIPYLRNTVAPELLNAIDPSLGSTYTQAVQGIDEGKHWTDIVGGVADNLTNGVGVKAAGLVGLGPQYEQASNLLKKGKEITGLSTTGVLKGISSLFDGSNKRSAEDSMVPGKRMRF